MRLGKRIGAIGLQKPLQFVDYMFSLANTTIITTDKNQDITFDDKIGFIPFKFPEVITIPAFLWRRSIVGHHEIFELLGIRHLKCYAEQRIFIRRDGISQEVS